MSDFIRVLGDDPHYKGRKTFMHIPVHSVQKVVAIYGVKDDVGGYWRCTPEHKGAQLISYQLTDLRENTYSCGHPEELEKLGITGSKDKPKIGFIGEEGKDDKTELEMTDEEFCPT